MSIFFSTFVLKLKKSESKKMNSDIELVNFMLNL